MNKGMEEPVKATTLWQNKLDRSKEEWIAIPLWQTHISNFAHVPNVSSRQPVVCQASFGTKLGSEKIARGAAFLSPGFCERMAALRAPIRSQKPGEERSDEQSQAWDSTSLTD
jgi:hypothetical protein